MSRQTKGNIGKYAEGESVDQGDEVGVDNWTAFRSLRLGTKDFSQ